MAVHYEGAFPVNVSAIRRDSQTMRAELREEVHAVPLIP
jgi:hypothetical protein